MRQERPLKHYQIVKYLAEMFEISIDAMNARLRYHKIDALNPSEVKSFIQCSPTNNKKK